MTIFQRLLRFVMGIHPELANSPPPTAQSSTDTTSTDPAIDKDAEKSMKPSPAPPAYIAAMPTSELLSEQKHDPADLDTAKEVRQDGLGARGIPL